ncbi:MAG: hypothetical protein HY727_06145 [Candidatus Rokubacteria bacterium]|nr:hypothetical protein [Candidatus Rokubacteria bacterium]
MIGSRVEGVGLLTGWGDGVESLPASARRAAGDRRVLPLARPDLAGDRFRRATRECLLGVAAVGALLRRAGLDAAAIRGSSTALVYVTAGAYGPSNRAFIEARAGGQSLHFPYTAPSAVPAEVAIEFGLTGGYLILIGGGATTIDALWQATTLVQTGACARALVLAVEVFEECESLWTRGRWLLGRPLVEAAACALLGPGESRVTYGPARGPSELERSARARAGQTLACEPLIGLALARERGQRSLTLTGEWRGRRATLEWN